MLGGERDGIAQPEFESFQRAVAARSALGFVRDEDQRFAGATHQRGEAAIVRGQPDAGIDHEEDRIRGEDGRFRLRAGPAGEARRVALLQSRRCRQW